MKKINLIKLVESWAMKNGNVHKTEDILKWICELDEKSCVKIKRNKLSDSDFWFLDKKYHVIKNKKKGFFSICALQVTENDDVVHEQPIIIQDEIGYLGIITKEIDGVLNFLMQAKIEPGNINKIQISPTIQATRSNFTRLHDGRKPLYLEYFLDAHRYEIIVDQLQSEQSSRFFRKRNRNIIIKVDDSVETTPSHKWMTLGQIKKLMRYNNIVNMDSRTVLSCLPFSMNGVGSEAKRFLAGKFEDRAFYNSVCDGDCANEIKQVYYQLNNIKMNNYRKYNLVGLDKLSSWRVSDDGITSNAEGNFKVIYCDIEIEGREVRKWNQPLFHATGEALFGLFVADFNGIRKFLVKLIAEVGCFDVVEIGPTVQLEFVDCRDGITDSIDKLFKQKLNKNENILYDVMLSEEGGRFYHEQNRNVIIKIDADEIDTVPNNYFWMDYAQLNKIIQCNNMLNIQLRNMLSLLEV